MKTVSGTNSYYKKGFTLVEMLVYIAILVVVMVVTISAILRYSVVVEDMQVRTKIMEVAHTSLERVVREVRNANDVNVALSDFTIATSTLALNADDYTTFISGTSSDLIIARNGGERFMLNSDDVLLDELYIYHYQSASDVEGVRFVATFMATSSTGVLRETFEAFSVIRGSYE